MSENAGEYRVQAKNPLSAEALRRRTCCHLFSDTRYRSPTSHEIESLIEFAGWTQSEFAQRIGVSSHSRGSSTIRRWKSDPESDSYRAMPYAAWRLALYESGLISVDPVVVH